MTKFPLWLHCIPRRSLSQTIVLILILGALPASVRPQDAGFGLGAVFGEPTGISAKNWVAPENAVDAGLAWAFGKGGMFHIHMDYLWHFRDVIRSQERFVLYAGIGGRVAFGSEPGIMGVRIPVGIEFWPRGIPLDVFMEVAPILDVVPSTTGSLNGGVGIRYFFR